MTVSQQVVNLHWTTKVINLLLEKAERKAGDNMVDSHDAKSIICTDIHPVQNLGFFATQIQEPLNDFLAS